MSQLKSFVIFVIGYWATNDCQVFNEHNLTKSFMNWIRTDTPYQLIECKEAMTGEDFGYFLDQIPGFMFWLGVDSPYGLHHPKLEPKEGAISVGINLMTKYITHLAGKNIIHLSKE